MKYLDVAFPLNVESSFQYLCPPELEELAVPGARVMAPLHGRLLHGLVVSAGSSARVSRVLPIAAAPDPAPLLDASLLGLVQWLAEYYLTGVGMALRAAVPPAVLRHGLAAPRADQGRLVAAADVPVPPDTTPTPRQSAVLQALLAAGSLPAAELIRRTGTDHRALRLMASRGLLRLSREEQAGRARPAGPPAARPEATPAQTEAIGSLGLALSEGVFRRILLQGPPGSGKMEVILRSLAISLPPDRQALILVPEISLTQPLVERLEDFFPSEVAAFHGRLPEGRRRSIWLACRAGRVRVVIGSRSAVFAPLPSLGVVVVDGEHDPSYKSEETPRYHAREAAIELARRAGVPVILSSPAPSLETRAMCGRKEAACLRLPSRAAARRVRFQTVDLRREHPPRGRSLSGAMVHALRTTLAEGRRAVLFVNRRGMAAAAFCADCLFSPRCPRCQSPLACDDELGLLLCRLCGFAQHAALECPRCGGSTLRPGSPGTKGVAGEAAGLFPGARLGVVDSDAVTRPGDQERIMAAFDRGEIDILVGTQMLARGASWPGVSLVGVVDADTALNRPDFRAAERTFQLLTELCGRAGQDVPRLKVVLQTRHPGHYAFQAVSEGDPDIFYRQEASLRAEAGFPPFGRLILIVIEDAAREALEARAAAIRRALDQALATLAAEEGHPVLEILGPHAAPRPLKRGLHRQQILLKGPTSGAVHRLAREGLRLSPASPRGTGRRLVVDVDPVDLL